MNNKLLTIIVPSYNMEGYLRMCLGSLVVSEDKMSLFEVLVINDGSKDMTSEIGHRFETRFPETFRVIDKENGHYGSCINRGLAEAQGTFVKVLDADDQFDRDVFEKYLDFLSRGDVQSYADIILSDYTEVDEDGNVKSYHHFTSGPERFTPSQMTQMDKLFLFIHGITHRTENLREMGYIQTEGISYTDAEWTLLPLMKAKNFYRFDGALYLYTKGRAEQTVAPKQHAKNAWMEIEVAKKILSVYKEKKASIPAESLALMNDCLQVQINHLYQLYLLTLSRFKPDLKPLKELDALLKSDFQKFYEKSDEYITTVFKMPFKPIYKWRRGESLKVQRVLYCIADKIGRIRKHI